MMKFDHGGGLGDGGKGGEGKEPEQLPDGPCISTKTPAGFKDVGKMRETLRGWVTRDQGMTIADFVQVDASGCFRRATEWIPNRWGVLTTQVTCNAPYLAFVETVTSKLNAKSFKPKVCICEYTKGNPIAGPTSTFANHWILIVGAGVNTSGRRFLIVFDPDPDATARSKKKWAACSKQDRETVPVPAMVLEQLVLGSGNKLGGLIRYFYA